MTVTADQHPTPRLRRPFFPPRQDAPINSMSDTDGSDSDSDSDSEQGSYSWATCVRGPMVQTFPYHAASFRPRPRLWADNPAASISIMPTGRRDERREKKRTRNYGRPRICRPNKRAATASSFTSIIHPNYQRQLGQHLKKSSHLSVTFADPLVTAVHYRPRTRLGDVEGLFYSKDDRAAFREEYKRECMLAQRKSAEDYFSSDSSSSSDEDSCDEEYDPQNGSMPHHVKPNEVTDSSAESSDDSQSSSEDESE